MTVREKQCTKCGETKPSNQFKRRLSIAQSRAVLRNPNINTNYMADSKLCKACQPKRKPPRELTIKEIRTRISNKDMHYITGETLLEKKRQSIRQGRSRVMRTAWEKRKNEPYTQLKKSLQQQVAKYANRFRASKHLQNATLLQNTYNYEQAKIIKQDLLEQAQAGVAIPPTIQIATLIKPKGEAQ